MGTRVTNDSDDDITSALTATATADDTPQASANSIPHEARPRTRGQRVNLSASLRALTRGQLVDRLKETTVNSVVQLTLSSGPLWQEEHITASVVACCEGGGRLFKVTASERLIQLPDPKNAVIATKIDIVTRATLSVPINLSNCDPKPTARTIYLDGGARPNPGPAAAAITVQEIHNNNVTSTSHARFFALGSNNIGEAIALLAALRLAHRLDGFSNIVMDTELLYKGVLGIVKIKDEKILPIVNQCRDVYISIAQRVALCTMRRQFGNPADKPCTNAILSASHLGDQTLFIDPPHLPNIPKVQCQPRAPVTDVDLPQTIFNVPTHLRDFARLYRYKTRSRVPTTLAPLWANVLKHYLQLFCNATPEGQEDAAIRLLMLPHLFLPLNCNNNRIQSHLQSAQPFNVELGAATHKPRQHRTEHRMTETVTRLAADRKMRAANRLVQSAAETDGDMPFEAKVNGLRSKILEGNFTSDIERKNVPAFSTKEVERAINSANRQASNAIDGYTKDLLQQAIHVDPEITQLLAEFLHWITCGKVSNKFRAFLTLARGVAIPKLPSSVRPICVSSIFLKLIGTIALERDGRRLSHHQYALNHKDGHKRIIHKVRNHTQNNPDSAVLRFDITNAYGTMPRAILQEAVKRGDITLQQFFRFVYGESSLVATFGPEDAMHFLTLGEGVKQGDATSSFLFCLGLDTAINMIEETLRLRNIRAHIYVYMDDITICCSAIDAAAVSHAVVHALAKIGLSVNEHKSATLTFTPGNYPLPTANTTAPFIVLGANINPTPTAQHDYCQSLIEKQKKYFDLLARLPLHPQLQFTLLRICGAPRILYYCAVTEPEVMKPVANDFDYRARKALESILDPTGRTHVNPMIAHSSHGAGLPAYAMHCHDIWNLTKRMALADDPNIPEINLYCNTGDEIVADECTAQLDAQWMFFDTESPLTPAQFRMALCIRLGILPHPSAGEKCNCGFHSTVPTERIEHILRCDQSTPLSHTYRHNLVRDAVIDFTRSYGITTTKEPTCFTYSSGKRQRPDILFHTQPYPLVTDVTLVASNVSLEHAEKDKIATHSEACSKQHTIFKPLAMHTRGTMGKQVSSLIRDLSKFVLPCQQRSFTHSLRHAISVAAAKGRADAVHAVIDRDWQ